MNRQAEQLFEFDAEGPNPAPDRALMGIKGSNLAEMAALGLPVPPGFVISTALGKEIAEGGDRLPDKTCGAMRSAVQTMETKLGKQFGGEDNPLLLSVRSGASISMPGMMDTVLNLGLNEKTVAALAKITGDYRFAWDSYRRFIQGFSNVVLEQDSDVFEELLEEVRESEGVVADAELSADALQGLTREFLSIVERETGTPFPQDVFEQLNLATIAVFRSWNTKRAIRYRDMQGMSHDGGTAAVVQAMVFGNRDENSCTGVYFTRNPSTGENKPYGEYMPNAQGEDVVSGIRTPMELTEEARAYAMSENLSLEKSQPDAYGALLACGTKLESHFSDMQEIEFTVESGRLFLLQTRTGKRTPKAGLKAAVDMVETGLISKEEAISRCDTEALATLLVSKVSPEPGIQQILKGLPASPGAVSGEIVFTSESAVEAQSAGKDCILVRPETDPKDVHGMNAAVGILTSRGGMTSHAAVVARGMGKPCITAAMGLKIDVANGTASILGQELKCGEMITIDGAAGTVYRGTQPVVLPKPDGALATLLQWKEESGN